MTDMDNTPDWNRLQRFIEHQYSHGKITTTYTTEGEYPPEMVLHEVQQRTAFGYEVMTRYHAYVKEAQKRGIIVDGW